MKDYNKLTNIDGENLVKTSRAIVSEYLKNNKKMNLDKIFETTYSFHSGVFVTLNNSKGLRGCIGLPLPDKKLFTALFDASIAAATEDPRFSPVKFEELDEITFEITVLTPPNQIHVDNPEDYITKIKVGRDGLIIKHSIYSGLLLPQVPIEYNWNEKEFLEYTCQKAGLPRDFWKKKDVKIYKFEGIAFKEETPKGKVTRASL